MSDIIDPLVGNPTAQIAALTQRVEALERQLALLLADSQLRDAPIMARDDGSDTLTALAGGEY